MFLVWNFFTAEPVNDLTQMMERISLERISRRSSSDEALAKIRKIQSRWRGAIVRTEINSRLGEVVAIPSLRSGRSCT